MHIILTHEQADFDALASLLGAHLLNDAAVPVLPRRMNRNVGAFLTLYGTELNFIDPRDLPDEPIDQVTLVDTQSMISVKGLVDNPDVRVIDHHPRKENLPEEWSVTTVEIGATTTLLTEALQEHNGPLTPIQATLLLLGIYEDTGSLTYTRTTARDLRASAYLVEQGANLHLASDFLNHPLSQAQQDIYDHLRKTAEHYHIHGHTIVVATGDAREMNEELSTLAHKLRDLLDPDAIFLLITTRGGVQLIARSTNDQIDVSDVAEHFGGGGHERAAAALIRERTLESVHTELVRMLGTFVRPAITVAQIMSRGPQLLPPDTPVEKAAERMRRFGYEGYPVVRDGKVVGLLTRRSVDRALVHKLNLTAASLMEAGEVSVAPGDSIEELQRIMTDSGWGQIPVVNPLDGKIIGIVTRTDLLKILAPKPKVPGRLNLASKLEAALPPARLALLKAMAQIAHEERLALYIVGGFVRDLLLERPSLDFDLVVEGDAIALADALNERYGGRVTSHSRFGTAKWHIAGIRHELIERLSEAEQIPFQTDPDLTQPDDLPASLDLVTARTEFYTHPTALPTVERGSIKLDLHRRDFTINTLALRLDGHHYGELHDYWGGLSDLRHGQVRVLHSLSFVDDPTRMLRAVRFEQRFGFSIETRTLELLHQALGLLARVSGDRIRHELNHILVEPNVAMILARLDDLKLLKAIHPDLIWDQWLEEQMELLPNIDPLPDWGLKQDNFQETIQDVGYTIWLLRLTVDKAEAVARRLKLPASLRGSVQEACRLWQESIEIRALSPSEATRRLEGLSPLARYAVYLASSDVEFRNVLRSFATHWQYVSASIDGHDLKSHGVSPGPVYRHILETLRSAWLDEEIQNQEEELALLNRLIQQSDEQEI